MERHAKFISNNTCVRMCGTNKCYKTKEIMMSEITNFICGHPCNGDEDVRVILKEPKPTPATYPAENIIKYFMGYLGNTSSDYVSFEDIGSSDSVILPSSISYR